MFAAPAPRCWCSSSIESPSLAARHGRGQRSHPSPPRRWPVPAGHGVWVRAHPRALPSSTREEQTNTSDLPHMSNPTITNPCVRTKGRNSVCWGKKNPKALSVSRLGGHRRRCSSTEQHRPAPRTAPHPPGAGSASETSPALLSEPPKPTPSLATLLPAASRGPSLGQAPREETLPAPVPPRGSAPCSPGRP